MYEEEKTKNCKQTDIFLDFLLFSSILCCMDSNIVVNNELRGQLSSAKVEHILLSMLPLKIEAPDANWGPFFFSGLWKTSLLSRIRTMIQSVPKEVRETTWSENVIPTTRGDEISALVTTYSNGGAEHRMSSRGPNLTQKTTSVSK